jgi:hypothetical protein
MTKTELLSLVESKTEDGDLDRADKVEITKEALTQGSFTNGELAEAFGCTKRSIRRYKADAKEALSSDLESLPLPGELYSEYRSTIGQLDQLLTDAEDLDLRSKLIWRRWKIIQDFLDRADRLTGEGEGFASLSDKDLERSAEVALELDKILER